MCGFLKFIKMWHSHSTANRNQIKSLTYHHLISFDAVMPC